MSEYVTLEDWDFEASNGGFGSLEASFSIGWSVRFEMLIFQGCSACMISPCEVSLKHPNFAGLPKQWKDLIRQTRGACTWGCHQSAGISWDPWRISDDCTTCTPAGMWVVEMQLDEEILCCKVQWNHFGGWNMMTVSYGKHFTLLSIHIYFDNFTAF